MRRAPSTKRVVIFKVAGKLYWPALVLSEDTKTVTARLFNKKSVVKTVQKENVKNKNNAEQGEQEEQKEQDEQEAQETTIKQRREKRAKYWRRIKCED